MKSKTRPDIFHIINYLLLIIVSLIFIIPIYTIVVSSLVGEAELARRGSFILYPQQLNWSAYKMLLNKNSLIYSGYANTLFVVSAGTACSLITSVMMAYGLSKKDMPLRNGIVFLVLVTMVFSAGMIPSFLLNKSIGLINSRWVIILPNLVSAWNMFILKNFFSALPEEIEEAAVMDGASPMKILFKIILPLSLPSIMTIGLFYAVGYWNAWFNAAIYINDIKKLPIQNIMRNIVINNDVKNVNTEFISPTDKPTSEALKSAVIVVSTAPILVIYPFIQKYFTKGVMVGSIKG